MKTHPSFLRRGLLTVALSLITSTALSAADAFEGRIHMDLSSGKKKDKMTVEYDIKNGKMRMEPQLNEKHAGSGSMGIIVDPQAREMIILMDHDGQKMFMRRPMPQPGDSAVGHAVKEHQMSAPVPTGRTEVIAGYPATEYRTTSNKGEEVDLWLASGLGPFMSFSGGNPMMGRGTPPPGWENFARDGNYFPMRVVTHDASGAETARMEVTSVEKTSLPDSLFSTEGYTEFSIPGMGGTGGFNPFKH
jgi:hypothetical protein